MPALDLGPQSGFLIQEQDWRRVLSLAPAGALPVVPGLDEAVAPLPPSPDDWDDLFLSTISDRFADEEMVRRAGRGGVRPG